MTVTATKTNEPSTLITVNDNIWIAEGTCVNFYGFSYPTRSVIVRMTSGDLWIWSPIALSKPLKSAVDDLGSPTYLVSPNKIHHLFLSEWLRAYPEAQLCGPASTIKKRADLDFDMTLTGNTPAVWEADFDQTWFTGSAFMDEVVFFHKASETVILADLSENFSRSFLKEHWNGWQRAGAKFWGITTPFGKAPLEWRLSFLKRAPTRTARGQVLAWNAKRVIMAHGEWQSSGGHDFLVRSFDWI